MELPPRSVHVDARSRHGSRGRRAGGHLSSAVLRGSGGAGALEGDTLVPSTPPPAVGDYAATVLVRVLGGLTAEGAGTALTGTALGGRRAQIALAALALEHATVSPEWLAATIWADPPSTWPVAIRGVIRDLRSRLAPLLEGGEEVIVTVDHGYRIGAAVSTDVREGEEDLQRAADLLGEGAAHDALQLAEPVSLWTPRSLLPGEDAAWLETHRTQVSTLARRAGQLVVATAGHAGAPERAVDAARLLVARRPLDETGHRLLIEALGNSGNRAEAVRAYEACRVLLAEELGVDPSERTVQAYFDVLGDPASTPRARVPVFVTSYVGREREQRDLLAAVGQPGLVTVTGRGGVGKSRLAAQVLRGAVDPVWWIMLGSVADNLLVTASVALPLGVGTEGPDVELAVARHCAAAGRLTLVLDGCEGARDAVGSLVARLIEECPLLTVVATSRLPLRVIGEVEVEVAPLAVPGPEAELAASTIARLMRDRLREGGADLDAVRRDGTSFVDLLRRCAGLPLAVELMAAHLAAMSPADLIDHLDDSVPGGSVSPDDSTDSTLRVILASSYAMLDPAEAAVFRRLAVLEGSVTLDLVRRVVADGDVPPMRVVRILRELTSAGLVCLDRSGPHWRYRQDDDVRAYASELSLHTDEERACLDRLAEVVRGLLPEDPQSAPGPFRDHVTELIEPLRALFTAGIAWRADRSTCLELAYRLHRYWAATNVDEGRFWLARLLEEATEDPWTPYATYALGYLDYWSGDTDRAIPELQAVVDQLDDTITPYVARSLIYLAGMLDDTDRGDEAVDYVRRAIEAARPFGVDLQVSALMGLGCVLSERVDPEAAVHAVTAMELCGNGGSPEQLAAALPTAAMVCYQVGDLERARAFVEQARPFHESRRIARVVLRCVEAGLALADGDLASAVRLGREADEDGSALGVDRELPLIRSILARALLASGSAVEARDRAAAALEAGLEITYDFPLAIGLETAALVLDGHTAAAHIGELLGAASALRERGSRPQAAPLVNTLPAAPFPDGAGDPISAAKVAIALLRDIDL